MRTRKLLAIAGLAGALALASAADAGGLALRPCRAERGFRCGTLTVPLDRSGRVPGTVGLRVAAQALRRGQRHRGLMVALVGGPGQGGVEAAPSFLFSLQPVLRRYRLAVLDQRGTGRSQPLDCPGLQRIGALSYVTADQIGRCAERIGPRRAFYSTLDSVEDIDALRVALRAPRIALMGVSYGTFVAQQYARVHPDRVARLILDSVIAPDGVDTFLMDTFPRVARVLREQCGRLACRGVTRDPVADVAALVARLNTGDALRGQAFDAHGRPREVSFRSPDEIFNTLVAGDLNPYLQPALPAAIRAAARGRPAALLRLRRIADGAPLTVRDLSFGLNVVTGCEDTRLPYPLTEPVERRLDLAEEAAGRLPAAELAPFDVGTAQRLSYTQSCLFFPPDAVAAPSRAPLPDVPALLLSGRLDLRTPLENARQVAAELPHGELVAVPGTGHDELHGDATGCAQVALQRFMSGRRVGRPCARESNALPVTPLPPRSLRDYRSAARVPGIRGRVVSAAIDTVLDAQLSMLQTVFAGFRSIRGGGLHGGSFHSRDLVNIVLHRYALVPGLRVSGRVDVFGDAPAGRLRIDGPGSIDGVLRVTREGGVRGVLGRRRVRSPPTFLVVASARASRIATAARRRVTGPDIPARLIDGRARILRAALRRRSAGDRRRSG